MEENQKPRPAFILLERGEKLAGWIYFPFYLVLISLGLSFLFMALGRDVTAPRNLLYMNIIYGVINFCVLTLCFRRYLGKSLRQACRFPGRFFAAVGIGFAIYYFGTVLATILIQSIEPGLENINDSALEQIAGHGDVAISHERIYQRVAEDRRRGGTFASISGSAASSSDAGIGSKRSSDSRVSHASRR